MSRSTTEYGYSTDDGINKQQKGREKSWSTRNNSSNVSAALNLELHNSDQGKVVVVSNNCYKTGKIPKSHCEQCYCKRSPVYPKLTMKGPEQEKVKLKKPRCKFMHVCCQHCTYYNDDQEQDQTQSSTALESDSSPENKIPESIPTKAASPQRKPPETPKKPAKVSKQDHGKKPIIAPKQDHLNKKPIIASNQDHVSKKPIIASNQDHLNKKPIIAPKQDHVKKPTIVSKPDHVKPFHNVKQFQVNEQKVHKTEQLHESSKSESSDDKNSSKVNKHIGKKKNKFSKGQISSNFSSTPTTISENEKEGMVDVSNVDKTVRLNTKASAGGNLTELNSFRKENYFDCHSTGNLPEAKESEEHKCVHKFVLDDRLIAQPLYADVFGTSRCTQCDKPIKSEVEHSNSNEDNAVAKDRTSYQANVFGKSACCIDRQAKYKINISSNSDRIEIKVPISFGACNDLFNTRFKIKDPASANSLALRHQKGVV